MSSFRTEQEEFWAGSFGGEYIKRNQGDSLLASNVRLFARVLRSAFDLKSCIEFGANIGMNLRALKSLYPDLEAHAIEINLEASRLLADVIAPQCIYNSSILDFEPSRQWDLTLIKGVLIHIRPDVLPKIYEKLVHCTSRYLMVAEYYNPVPVAIPYRGHKDRLFKRDFVGEILDSYPQMKLIDYGFVYHRDPSFPQDDITWFLMERK